MTGLIRRLLLPCLLPGAFAPAHAASFQPITNGQFVNDNGRTSTSTPSGNITGSCNAGFASSSTNGGCIAGLSPEGGATDADMSTTIPVISDNFGGYDDAFSQSFVVPTATITAATAQFDDSVVCNGAGAYSGCAVGIVLFDGNTIVGSLHTFDGGAGNVIDPWQTYTWNVTSDLEAYEGDTLTLELLGETFFNTITSGSSPEPIEMNAAFDFVSLSVITASSTPELATTALIAGGFLLMGFLKRRTR